MTGGQLDARMTLGRISYFRDNRHRQAADHGRNFVGKVVEKQNYDPSTHSEFRCKYSVPKCRYIRKRLISVVVITAGFEQNCVRPTPVRARDRPSHNVFNLCLLTASLRKLDNLIEITLFHTEH